MENFSIDEIREMVVKAEKKRLENPSISSLETFGSEFIYPTTFYPKTGMLIVDYPDLPLTKQR